MSTLPYINQTAPFWDFVASMQEQGGRGDPSQDRRGHRGPMPHHPHHRDHHDHPRGREPPPPGLFDDADFVDEGPPEYEGSPDTMMGDSGEKEVNEKKADAADEAGPSKKEEGKRPEGRGRHHGCRRGAGFRGRGGWGGPGAWGRHPHGGFAGPFGGEDERGPCPPHVSQARGADGPDENSKCPFRGRFGPPAEGVDERGPFPFGPEGGDPRGPFPWGSRGRGPCGGRGGFFSAGRGRGPFGQRGFRGFGPFGGFMSENRDGEQADFKPEFDVFDTETSFVAHVSLPGAKKEDVGVNWDPEKSELAVTGVIHRPGNEEFIKTLAMDGRAVGPFEAKIRLGTRASPAQVEAEAITAKLDEGVLVVDVPKLEQDAVLVKKVEIE